MIFIPKENIKINNLDGKTENIFWSYNYCLIIVIRHYKEDESCSYIECINDCSFDSFNVLSCPELACSQKPQLRFNNIIKKYFCTCPSSMICTHNTDEDEINHFKNVSKINKFNASNGFYKDPLSAICHWQINAAKNYMEMAKIMKGKY